ncbi:MAG: response regulator [Lachnospiraceae bacterium]|nr:response regulator [Lachnospiraceae bacterium]
MGFMKYNIDFELFGSIIVAVILVFFKLKYPGKSVCEKSFIRLAVTVLIAQIMDMATAVTISIGGPEIAVFNLIFTSAYFAVSVYSGLFFGEYIITFAYKDYVRKYRILIRVIGGVYVAFLLINVFFGFYFYFDPVTGDYIHGPAYFVLYTVPGLLTLNSLFLILWHRKVFDRKQFISALSFIFFVILGLLLQITVMPDVYITYGLVTISFVMIVFSLETPDYQKLMKTMEELESARTEAEEARQEALAASNVKSDFLANMSHEIRTPINSILGFDEIILRESGERDIVQYASNIKRSGQTLLALINDILDLSKIESGKMEIIPVNYDLKELLTDLYLMIAPKAEEKKISLRFEVDRKLPYKLRGDDVRIRQVIMNLLSNAVKYTEKGEVLLRLSLVEAGEITRMRLSIRDSGIGIKSEDRERLFAAFQRVDESRNRNIEGTGLGLSICIRTLELMDSRLELESEYGKGSEFSFELEQEVTEPYRIGDFDVAQASGRSFVAVSREGFYAPKARMLVVDDVEMNRKVFSHLLKNTKMAIDTAESGSRALEMIKGNRYDLIFMDHLMPGMDGIETLKKGKEEGLIGKLPVIALTANAISGAKEMFLAEGFSDYLSKPVEYRDLEAMIIKYLPPEKVER